MSKPKGQNTKKPIAAKQPEFPPTEAVRTFSDEEIRTRAYQIYESGNRKGHDPEADWSQAETELMELLHAK